MADFEMVELPRWVERAVLPQRTRDTVSAQVRREGLLAGASLAIVALLTAVWARSTAPFPSTLWLYVPVFIGAAFRWWRLSSARRWLDSNHSWSTVAALPKSAYELRLERWRISDALFWSVVATVVVAVATLAIVVIDRQS